MVTGANPPAPDGAETLTVMTANLYVGEGDGLALVAAANAEDVDLLVVQEVTAGLLATMEAGGLEDLFPHRAGEPAEDAGGPWSSLVSPWRTCGGLTPRGEAGRPPREA